MWAAECPIKDTLDNAEYKTSHNSRRTSERWAMPSCRPRAEAPTDEVVGATAMAESENRYNCSTECPTVKVLGALPEEGLYLGKIDEGDQAKGRSANKGGCSS